MIPMNFSPKELLLLKQRPATTSRGGSFVVIKIAKPKGDFAVGPIGA